MSGLRLCECRWSYVILPTGWTALHVAAWNGHDSTLALLLKRKADIGAENGSGLGLWGE